MLVSNIAFNYFLHWSQVYASNDPVWIAPANENAVEILPMLIPPAPNQVRIKKFLANPGMGMFVIFPGTNGERYLVLIHHFFRMTAGDHDVKENEKIFAFYDVKSKHCVVEIPLGLFDESASNGPICLPRFQDLMEIDSEAKLGASKQPKEAEDHDKVELAAMTPVPAEIMNAIIEADSDPVQAFLNTQVLLKDKLKTNNNDITKLTAYSLAMQTMWAAALEIEDQQMLSTAAIEMAKDPVAIKMGMDKTLHLFGPDGHQQANQPMVVPQPPLTNLDPFTPFHEAGIFKKKGFKSLLASTQQMLLFAMMAEGKDKAPTEPLPDLNNLFDGAKDLAAPYMHQVTRKLKLHMVVDQKTALNLKTLELSADENDISKAYSIFLCGEKDSKHIDINPNASESEVRKQLEQQSLEATKTKIKIPKSCDELLTHLENFMGLSSFIFGSNSPLVHFIKPWIELCKDSKSSIKQQAHEDTQIYAKMLTIIDNKTQKFLTSCRDAGNVKEINYKALNSEVAIEVFRQKERAQAILSPVVKAIFLAETNSENQGEEWVTKHSPNKRAKTSGFNNNSSFNNSNTAQNESIDKTFKAKYQVNFTKMMAHRDDIPEWDGNELCARFHCSGFCKDGPKCPRAATHKKLPDKNQNDLYKWFEKHTGVSQAIKKE